MMSMKCLTAESVCIGHPDKLCDQIADSILDAYLRKDASAHVAIEVMATGHRIFISGEVTSAAKISKSGIRKIAWDVLENAGLPAWKYLVSVYVHKQSADIDRGVNFSIESRNGDTTWYSTIGAGDQGTVYGYSCDENFSHIPMPLYYAHSICERLDKCRKDGIIHGICPDGKAQVTLEYENDVPKRVKAIVVSIQHKPDVSQEQLKSEIISNVLWPVFEKFPFDDETDILINPSGRFVKGGAEADTGVTGRKLMVDTYGGLARQGGGALSGKDPTKVDRSGAYMARWIANHVIWCGYAKRCEVSISYAIGKADPVGFEIDTFGTGKVSEEILKKAVLDVFCLRPAAIIEQLCLRNAGYADTAVYGHFGRGLRTWDSFVCSKDKEFRKAVEKYVSEENND